jgi:hypothetical protein
VSYLRSAVCLIIYSYLRGEEQVLCAAQWRVHRRSILLLQTHEIHSTSFNQSQSSSFMLCFAALCCCAVLLAAACCYHARIAGSNGSNWTETKAVGLSFPRFAMASEADDVLEIGADGAYEVVQQLPDPPAAAAAPSPNASVGQRSNSTAMPREWRRPVIEPGLANIKLPLPHGLPRDAEPEAEAFFSGASESEKSEVCASEQDGETDVDPYDDDNDSEDAGFHDTLEDPRGMTKDAAKANQMKEQVKLMISTFSAILYRSQYKYMLLNWHANCMHIIPLHALTGQCLLHVKALA